MGLRTPDHRHRRGRLSRFALDNMKVASTPAAPKNCSFNYINSEDLAIEASPQWGGSTAVQPRPCTPLEAVLMGGIRTAAKM